MEGWLRKLSLAQLRQLRERVNTAIHNKEHEPKTT